MTNGRVTRPSSFVIRHFALHPLDHIARRIAHFRQRRVFIPCRTIACRTRHDRAVIGIREAEDAVIFWRRDALHRTRIHAEHSAARHELPDGDVSLPHRPFAQPALLRGVRDEARHDPAIGGEVFHFSPTSRHRAGEKPVHLRIVHRLPCGKDNVVRAVRRLRLVPRNRRELRLHRRVCDDDKLPRLKPERRRREDERFLQRRPHVSGNLARSVEGFCGVAPVE